MSTLYKHNPIILYVSSINVSMHQWECIRNPISFESDMVFPSHFQFVNRYHLHAGACTAAIQVSMAIFLHNKSTGMFAHFMALYVMTSGTHDIVLELSELVQ